VLCWLALRCFSWQHDRNLIIQEVTPFAMSPGYSIILSEMLFNFVSLLFVAACFSISAPSESQFPNAQYLIWAYIPEQRKFDQINKEQKHVT
jgi:hypothetical protein